MVNDVPSMQFLPLGNFQFFFEQKKFFWGWYDLPPTLNLMIPLNSLFNLAQVSSHPLEYHTPLGTCFLPLAWQVLKPLKIITRRHLGFSLSSTSLRETFLLLVVLSFILTWELGHGPWVSIWDTVTRHHPYPQSLSYPRLHTWVHFSGYYISLKVGWCA